MRRDVTTLGNKVNSISGTGPRTGQQAYVRTTAYNSGTRSYDGTDVIFNPSDPNDWPYKDNGRTWGDTTDDVGQIYAIDSEAQDLLGVYPLYRFSDGSSTYWGITPGGAVEIERIAFGEYEDGGKIRFYSGTLNVDDRAILEFTEPSGGFDQSDGYFYIEFDSTLRETITASDSEIQYTNTKPTFWERTDDVVTIKWLLGEWGSGQYYTHWEGDVNELGFGGKTETETFDFVTDIDTSEDTVGYWFDELYQDHKVGLLNDSTKTLASGYFGQKFVKWLGLETGTEFDNFAVAIHKKSPAIDSIEDQWGSISWDGTDLTWDGTTVSAIDIDVLGHIYSVNGENMPGPTVNYRYVGCGGLDTGIVLDANYGSTIGIGSACYTLDGTTQEDAIAATIDSTYSTCAACLGDASAWLWRKCSDDAAIAIVGDAAGPMDDYAWLCSGSVYVKGYRDIISAGTPTTPDFLEQCGTTPADCSDLVGFPVDDGFSGSGCDSGVVDDNNWTGRWLSQNGAASASITGGSYVVNAALGTQLDTITRVFSQSGDWEAVVDWSISHNTGTNASNECTMYAYAGGTESLIGKRYDVGSGQEIRARVNAGSEVTFSTTATSGKFRIRKTAGTIYCDYDIGGGWVTLTSTSGTGTLTQVSLFATNGGNAGTAAVSTFNSVSVTPTTYIDPTGGSC